MSDETTVVELDAELQTIADQLDKLSLLQASKLVKHLEESWGVSAAAPAAVAMAPADGAGGGEEGDVRPGTQAYERRLRYMEASWR